MNPIEQVRPAPGTEGKGQQPTLVFVHGFLDGAAAWDEVVTALGDQAADALCIDLPGMGSRTSEKGPYSLDRFAEDVAAQVSALARPVVIVGHSMGAQIAELVAGQLREKVRGLVLLTPVPLKGTSLPDEVMKTFHALGGNPAAQRDLRRNLSFNLDDARLEMLSQLGDRVQASSVGVFADTWNRGHPLGVQHTLYNGPVLIIRGEADSFVTGEMIGSMTRHFNDATIVSIDKAGHWPHVEQPEAVARILGEFLATVEETTGTAVAQQGWTRAFEQKSAVAFADAFTADVVLEASVLAKPVTGVEQVKAVMEAASKIYESLAFTREARNGQRDYLEWEAQAFGGEKLYGITVLTKDEEGKILRIAIHHRPLSGALKFSAELGRRLQGKLETSLFYSAA